ncbi:MAG: hypothetical protein ACRD2L_06050 [Terriglobia bacterium]
MTEDRRYASCALIIAFLLVAHLFFMHTPLRADETFHIRQVHKFLAGSFTPNPSITTIPGYHYILFALAKLTGWQTNASLRLFSLLFGIGCVILIWRLTTSVYRKVLFACVPIIFPYFFLVYTDIASLFFVLLGLYFIQAHKYTPAAFAAIIACSMRQTDIVWLTFLGLYAYIGKFGFTFDSKKKKWIERNLWSFALGLVLFLLFLLWNHGNVSLGDLRSHPTGPLHMSNVWFMLFLFALLFLPFALPKALETVKRFWRKPLFWIATPGVFIFFLVSFTNTHPYNLKWANYFIRNAILIFSTQSLAHKTLFFIPIFITLAALISTKLDTAAQYLLYPMSVLFLVPSWLIEPRYYIIPFTLFIVFAHSFFSPHSNNTHMKLRNIMNCIWIGLLVTASVALLILVAKGRVFL